MYNLIVGDSMKIVYVIDSISNLNHKINLLTTKLGSNIVYVVKADLVQLFKTYGYQPNAIYHKNLTKVIHNLLLKSNVEDIIICYSSLKFDNSLLTKFTNSIGNKQKIVSIMPKYNTFEQMCNATYNVYVKSLFKTKDSLVSPKLQFIPSSLAIEFLSTHLGNRLFELDGNLVTTISIENQEINKSMKVKTPALKFNLLAIIIALVLTAGLLASIAYLKAKYLVILTFIILFILNISLTIIFICKAKFDQRFFK